MPAIAKMLVVSFFSLFRIMKDKGEGPLFIVGTGRSGTHYLCKCISRIEGVDDLFGGKESKYIFNHVAKSAVNGKSLGAAVIGYYSIAKRIARPNLLLDQTHPMLWYVESILQQFPKAKFVALKRDVYSVVYSMINHRGVSAWGDDFKKYPVPNKFLGISENNKDRYYETLTPVQRHVFRYCSHMNEIERLQKKFNGSFLVIEYESLAKDMAKEMEKIASFIGRKKPVDFVEFDDRSLSKFKKLTPEQKREVDTALELYKRLQ